MYLLSLCALTLWPFLPVSEAMWPKPVRKMDTERMKSVTKKEIERALFPLPYGTYRPLQIDCATWNYHILWQNPSKKTVTWWGSTGKWVYSNLDEDQKREVIAKKGTEKKRIDGKTGFTEAQKVDFLHLCSFVEPLQNRLRQKNVDWLYCHTSVISFWMNLIAVSDCCSGSHLSRTIAVNSSCVVLAVVRTAWLFFGVARTFILLCSSVFMVFSFCNSLL